MSEAYIVAGRTEWNRRIFQEVISQYPGDWFFIGSREELAFKRIQKIKPRYLFFLHWSWRVPTKIIRAYECVLFHPTDLPYGRGGTPVQNLLLRGHKKTKLTAFKMTKDFDAGPIYLKEDLCLEGNAEEIYIRASYLAAKMIKHIINTQIKPTPQTGEIIVFKRRKPKESEIKKELSLQQLYDFIRMLDAEGYPNAFLIHKGVKYKFNRADLYNERIEANVTITPIKKNVKIEA